MSSLSIIPRKAGAVMMIGTNIILISHVKRCNKGLKRDFGQGTIEEG